MNTPTSYLTISAASDYYSVKMGGALWDNFNPDDRLRALVQASMQIDTLAYVGQKLVNTQEHEFPRDWHDATIDEVQYDTDGVPLLVKWAVCDQALALLDGFDANEEMNNLATVRQEIGAKIQWDRSAAPPIHLAAGLCAEAYMKIKCFLRDQSGIAMSRT